MVYSVHVGCDDVDESVYPVLKQGWKLPGAARSARQMFEITKRLHPTADSTLIDERPTVAKVADAMTSIGERIKKNEDHRALVIFTYVGHGADFYTPAIAFPIAPIVAVPHDRRHYQTTILLWDRMMVAHEFGRILVTLPPDALVFVIIDGCGEGAYYGFHNNEPLVIARNVAPVAAPGAPPISMSAPANILTELYQAHRALYDRLAKDPGPIGARLVYFGACKAGETTWMHGDGSGSFFSGAIHDVMSEKRPPSTYVELHARVSEHVAKLITQQTSPMHPPLYAAGSATAVDLERAPFN